jgi:2,4-dienoyl-CoA reductase-like NADH-dependent reductase (Old Yellow Enzyme family)
MSLLFSAIDIKNVHLKNRIVVSPMCQYTAVDGYASDWHLVHLGSRAVGGAGLIIQEATSVSPEGRISPGDLGIWSDDHLPMLKRITDFIHKNGSIAGIQLAHAGRKASFDTPWKGGKCLTEEQGGWVPLAPSAIPVNDGDTVPEELSIEDIEQLKQDFRAATERSVAAGYKVIEIHAAHGYLFHQFLSPLTNKRTDQYGGSFENRIRVLLETIATVQEVWSAENPLFVRISATDWADGGWTSEESVSLSKILKEKGIDLIDCSSGGLVPYQKIPVFAGYQVQFAEQVKKGADILTGAVGLITEPQQAEDILKESKADLIFLAREMLRDPYFPLHAAAALGDDIKWPDQYDRAKRKH